MNLTRREFLALTAAVLETSALGLSPSAWAKRSTEVDLSALPEKAGERYLHLFPEERDLPRLRQTLYFQSGSDPAAIKAKLLADIHADFVHGRTFRYEGWILSRTEGRLCAFKLISGN